MSAAAFRVGPWPIRGDVILAPMDGVTDPPFRGLGRMLGSAIAYTEFIHAADVLQRPQWVWRRLRLRAWERPIFVQIYGHTVNMLVEAALRVQEVGPAAIDINMGCPDPRIAGRGAGAGLLRTPVKVARLFRRLSRALEIPVTAKIRLGWDDACRNHRLIARVLEENGAALIAVHGRTRAQGYRGRADWDAIAEVAAAVRVPVVGNGDVRRAADIDRLKAHAGVAAVMIGRGALDNPWLLQRRDREGVPRDEVWAVLRWHLRENLAHYGLSRGLVLFRKFAARYLAPYGLSGEQRRALLTREDVGEFLALAWEALGRPQGGAGLPTARRGPKAASRRAVGARVQA
ncbi:MAG: tRNA-dihydrouridine synthase family protein [Chloroflexi bacterium]|nr:tRNA-dihydrouridine synthase family protein [Chloroflexota bacterium]